jgi:hypothetical protein
MSLLCYLLLPAYFLHSNLSHIPTHQPITLVRVLPVDLAFDLEVVWPTSSFGFGSSGCGCSAARCGVMRKFKSGHWAKHDPHNDSEVFRQTCSLDPSRSQSRARKVPNAKRQTRSKPPRTSSISAASVATGGVIAGHDDNLVVSAYDETSWHPFSNSH